MFISTRAIFDKRVFPYCSRGKEDGPAPIPVEAENPARYDPSQDDNHQSEDLEPCQDVLVQQPLGLGYPNQPPFPPDVGHASENTSPWRPPSETGQPLFKEESQPISPLFYNTPIPQESPKTTPLPSDHPPSYHSSPIQPAKKQTTKVKKSAKPPKVQVLPGWTTSEEEDEPQPPPTAGPSTCTWMPPWQAPEESLVQFQIRPHQYHPTRDERSLFRPSTEVHRSTRVPVSQILPDNTYGDRPPIEIKWDL